MHAESRISQRSLVPVISASASGFYRNERRIAGLFRHDI
jgi:hypothetical protein